MDRFRKDTSFIQPRTAGARKLDLFGKQMSKVGLNLFAPMASDDAIKKLDQSYGQMFDDSLKISSILGAKRQSEGFGSLTSGIESFSKNLSGLKAPGGQRPFAGAIGNLFSKYGGFGAQPQLPGTGTGQPIGGMANLGGKWAPIDQWSPQISAAVAQVQQETGVYVPPNVVKAIMMIETGGTGQMLDENYAGASGLMQITPMSMGSERFDFNRIKTDPAYNIWAGVTELALRYQDAMRENPAYDWSNVATGYFSGHYVPNGAGDAWTKDYEYKDTFARYLQELDAGTTGNGQMTAQAVANGGIGAINLSAFTGGQSFPITQGLGPTEFAMGAGAWMYGYGAAYGIQGHPGIDIGMPVGTQLTTPWSGTVTCIGSSGSGSGEGCGFYGDENGGLGRIQINLDNGDVVIFGHTSRAAVQLGQRVNAGDLVGYSGSMNGPHVHLEYRQKGHNTPSGYKVIDPSNMSGMQVSGYNQTSQQGSFSTGGNRWQTGQTYGTPSWYGSYSPGSISSRFGRGW